MQQQQKMDKKLYSAPWLFHTADNSRKWGKATAGAVSQASLQGDSPSHALHSQ